MTRIPKNSEITFIYQHPSIKCHWSRANTKMTTGKKIQIWKAWSLAKFARLICKSKYRIIQRLFTESRAGGKAFHQVRLCRNFNIKEDSALNREYNHAKWHRYNVCLQNISAQWFLCHRVYLFSRGNFRRNKGGMGNWTFPVFRSQRKEFSRPWSSIDIFFLCGVQKQRIASMEGFTLNGNWIKMAR